MRYHFTPKWTILEGSFSSCLILWLSSFFPGSSAGKLTSGKAHHPPFVDPWKRWKIKWNTSDAKWHVGAVEIKINMDEGTLLPISGSPPQNVTAMAKYALRGGQNIMINFCPFRKRVFLSFLLVCFFFLLTAIFIIGLGGIFFQASRTRKNTFLLMAKKCFAEKMSLQCVRAEKMVR